MNTIRRLSKTGLSLNTFIGRALVTLVVSSACLAIPVGPALADGMAPKVPAETVRYQPQKLAQTGYADSLYTQIEQAAGKVCEETADVLEKTRPRGHKMVVFGQREADFGRCFDESIARAVDDVDSPELRAVHEQIRTGVVRVAAIR